MSGLGLAIDDPHLTPALLAEATESILKTRDGSLRAAVPRPIGTCHFVGELGPEELEKTLTIHRELCRGYQREGSGEEMSSVPVGVAEPLARG